MISTVVQGMKAKGSKLEKCLYSGAVGAAWRLNGKGYSVVKQLQVKEGSGKWEALQVV